MAFPEFLMMPKGVSIATVLQSSNQAGHLPQEPVLHNTARQKSTTV